MKVRVWVNAMWVAGGEERVQESAKTQKQMNPRRIGRSSTCRMASHRVGRCDETRFGQLAALPAASTFAISSSLNSPGSTATGPPPPTVVRSLCSASEPSSPVTSASSPHAARCSASAAMHAGCSAASSVQSGSVAHGSILKVAAMVVAEGISATSRVHGMPP